MLVDIYCHSAGDEAHKVINQLLRQMLSSSNADCRVHAFNLMFNLSVHVSMVEHVSVLLEDGKRNLDDCYFTY